jgi:two-component system nitrogen regulation response regulator NtrX
VSQTVLIVDDELDIQSSLSLALRDEGYHVLVATLPEDALQILNKEVVDVGLFDVWFPKGDGIELLKTVRQKYPRILPIMMSGHGTIELALSAIRLGAYDFLEKPLELEKVLVILKNALETRDLRNENERLNHLLFEKGQMLGSSQTLAQLKAQIQRASVATSCVTLVGEIGVGKNLCARLLHDLSARKKQPLVIWSPLSHSEENLNESLFGTDVNQNGSPIRKEGALEYVREGTLVITDVEKVPSYIQSRLAEALKSGSFLREGGRQVIPFKGRVVVTTARPLSEEQRFGKISPELFHLLHGIEIFVPPLRERKEDILEIFDFFVSKASADRGLKKVNLSPELCTWLLTYDWPGNIRELKNLSERILILAGEDTRTLTIAHLPEEIQNAATNPEEFSGVDFRSLEDPDGPLRKLRAEFEKSIILQRLHKMGGNVTKTAESLGIERAHLHRKMRTFGIHSGRDGAGMEVE